MKIAFYGDSLTAGTPGASYFRILEAKLPEYELINHGKGGDTVKSLYRRIIQKRLDQSVDVAFLWVGVNDVFAKVTFTHSILKRLVRQPWAKDHAEFRDYYARILNLLCSKATKVVAVSTSDRRGSGEAVEPTAREALQNRRLRIVTRR